VVRDVTRRYQEIATRVIEDRGGHVAQFAGDGVLAYFGFPSAREDDARRAVLAALELRDRVHDLSDAVRRELGVELAARIGLHTGVVLHSDMGSPDAPERDAIVGLTPNQAARVETAAPAGEVAISDATADVVRGYFELESLGRPAMKGIAQHVEILRVIGPTHAVDRLQAAGRMLTPLVGREREVAVLNEAWESLRTPGGDVCTAQTVVVRGEAGIGKSRIAEGLVQRARENGSIVFIGNCETDRSASPLFPIIRMLGTHFGFEAHDNDEARLATIEAASTDAGLTTEAVPLLAELLGLPPSARYEPLQLSSRARRDRVFDAITALVVATAQRQRSLVLIEDLQWADRTSLELLTHLSLAATPAGLLILGTARPQFKALWRGPCHTTVDLGPLPAADSEALVRTLAEIYGIAEDLWGTIAERSDGNPLFTEELAKSASRSGDAQVARDMIPTTIRDLLTARLDALGNNKYLAQIAAVIGRDVDFELLRDATGWSRRQVSTGLAELVKAGIMEPSAIDHTMTHRFVHALVRDAAYDSQERLHDRRDSHLRVAQALRARPTADAGIIAQHLDGANRIEEALDYYTVAAASAQEAAADVEAIRYLDRALELVEGMPEGSPRDAYELNIRILRGLSNVNLQGYAAAAAAEDYRRGLHLSERAGTDIALFPATAGIWAYYAVHGDLRAAGEATDRLVAMMHPEVDAEILSCTGVQHFFEGRFSEAKHAFDSAIAVFTSRPEDTKMSARWLLPSDPLVAALTHLAVLRWLVGDSAGSTDLFEQANARAIRLPFPTGPFSRAYAMSYEGWLANLTGRYEEGRTLHESTMEIGERYGLAFWSATGACHWAISRGHLGEPEQAIEILEPAIEQWRALGAEAFVPCFRTQLAEIRLAVGQFDAALHDVDQAIEQAERTGEEWFSAESYRLRAAIMQRMSPTDVNGALVEVGTARRLAGRQGALMFELRAMLDELELRTESGRVQPLEELHELIERCPAGTRGAEVARARALLEATD
jgi:class 3 adenylate cyclase/predicted ATPase